MDFLKHIEYCPDNITLSDIWINHGLSHCFADTVSSSVLAGYMLIFGIFQLFMYRKYATPIEDPSQISSSKLYYFQVLLLLFVPILSVVRLILESFVFDDAHVYGYTVSSWQFITFAVETRKWITITFQILAASFTCFSLLFSIVLLIKERYYLLPSTPTRGHGLILLVFWSLIFINENLSIMNLKKEDWWFHIDSIKDKVEMILFVTRYVSCLLIFVLGLKAPGIESHREADYIHLQREASTGPRSTWANGLHKLKTLAPFLWPKKSFALQLRVIICICMLIGGRVINVAVPIYSQKIGKLAFSHILILKRRKPLTHRLHFLIDSRQFDRHCVPVGLDSDVRCIQISSRWGHRQHGHAEQFSIVSMD